ncbi:MAG TPA: hypothetical protein DCF33_22590 [Saprospirales bacterium]|nr:hypothetical protein [Saprospirales bacterium]
MTKIRHILSPIFVLFSKRLTVVLYLDLAKATYQSRFAEMMIFWLTSSPHFSQGSRSVPIFSF